MLLVGTITLAPIGFVISGSFNVSDPGQPARLGLAGWQEVLLRSQATLTAIRYTFLLSLRAPAAVLLGFAIAWLLVRVRIPGRTFIEFGLWVAFFMPVLPVTLGWILLLDPHYGLLNDVTSRLPVLTGKPFNIYSLGGIVWIHMTTTTVPVMVILLLPALRRFDAAFEDSARMCGSGSLRIMRRITLPILAPAIVTALIAGLIRSLEAFEVEQLLGTPAKIQVYATRIYNYISVDPAQYPPAMALSTLFLAVLLVLALVYQRFTGRQQVASVTARGMSLRPVAAASWRYIASAILIGLVCISVIVPVVMLVTGSFMRGFGFFSVDHPYTSEHWLAVFRDPVFVSSAAASLQVGLAVAIGGVALYSLL
ncbi:MAG TPA: ABC transporter permease subunit, partial [Chloroflexota bacterium]|nr:ABC transporter permease subunit [Chloroflexota bacterium]